MVLACYHQAPAAPAVKTTEKAPKKPSEKATKSMGKKVEPEKEEPLDPLAEKLRQQRYCFSSNSCSMILMFLLEELVIGTGIIYYYTPHSTFCSLAMYAS